MLAGYLHPDYPGSLSALGTPQRLPASGGWILKRPIPGTSFCDGMGCYPLLCCVNWGGLQADIEALHNELVTLVAVADPLGDYSPGLLEEAFDSVVAFKEHFVVETGRPLEEFVSRSHRARALRALKDVDVERCQEPIAFIDEWERLYGVLTARHSITGPRRFSRSAVETQLAVPGMVMFRAVAGGETVGLDLWYAQNDCAQGHLAAFDSAGYDLGASYATKWRALEYFNDKVRWINLGAGTAGGGLTQFKRGWSTGTRTAWLCGRVLQANVYAEIVRARGVTEAGYFPAYRTGEFAAS